MKTILESVFFKTQLTLLDFLIIGLGTFLFIYQVLKRFLTFSGSFYRKAHADKLFLTMVEVKLHYISNLIELLPIMGILGTVWGLRNALVVIATKEIPGIKDIATEIAPALSTTFFGLLFAVLNLFFFQLFAGILQRVDRLVPSKYNRRGKRWRANVLRSVKDCCHCWISS